MSSRPKQSLPPLPSALHSRFRLESVMSYETGATVYKARDLEARRDVQVVLYDDSERARRPSKLRSSIPRHPGLANVLEFNEPGYEPYQVLEMPRGKPLSRVVSDKGRYVASDFMNIGTQLLLAVSHLHELGFVHGNLHGDNVYVLGEDPRTSQVKVAGIHACERDRGSNEATDIVSRPDIDRFEQHPLITRERPDVRNDVFALGLLLIDAIDLTTHAYDDVPTRKLLALCNRCMASNRTQRPADAGALLESFVDCVPQASRVTAQRPASSMAPEMGWAWSLRKLRGHGANAMAALVVATGMVLILPPHGCTQSPQTDATVVSEVEGAAPIEPVAAETPSPAETSTSPSPAADRRGGAPSVVPVATAAPTATTATLAATSLSLASPSGSCDAVKSPPTVAVATRDDVPLDGRGSVHTVVVTDPEFAEAEAEAAAKRERARRLRNKRKRRRRSRARRNKAEQAKKAQRSGVFMGVTP